MTREIEYKTHWQKVDWPIDGSGYLTFYYSSSEADIPCRDVRKEYDSKIDPNMETSTYGVFTNCQCCTIRRPMLNNRKRILFFSTTWRGERVITGFYEVGWIGVQNPKHQCKHNRQSIALKASRAHFTLEGIRLTKNSPFFSRRGNRKLTADQGSNLMRKLEEQDNILADYIRWTKILEERNRKETGFCYPNLRMEDPLGESKIPVYLGWES